MNATTAELATLLPYPALSLLSAWLGYIAATHNRDYLRRKSSLAEVAEALEAEAGKWIVVGCRLTEQGEWVDEKFYFDARAREWLQRSVKRLTSDIAYVQRNHPAIWTK